MQKSSPFSALLLYLYYICSHVALFSVLLDLSARKNLFFSLKYVGKGNTNFWIHQKFVLPHLPRLVELQEVEIQNGEILTLQGVLLGGNEVVLSGHELDDVFESESELLTE